MAHYLTLLKNGQVLDKRKLDQSVLKIGRGEACGLRIYDAGRVVSRQHAEVAYFDHRYWVRNDQGLCGTLVNGTAVEAWYPLEQADAIIVGSHLVIYSYGYTWDPDGPTLYSGPDQSDADSATALEHTVMIRDHQRPEYVRIEYRDGRQQLIYRDLFTIGRTRANTVWLPDRSVAPVHAEMFTLEDEWFVRDLSGANDVLVSKCSIEPELALRSGQTIQVGRTDFRFHLQKN